SGPAGSYTLSFGSGTLTAATSGTITLSPASTATTITGHTPNPSVVGQAIAVTFTVSSSGGTPTGNVTVSAGSDTCTGTVAAGTCNLTATSAGAKTLVATYAGDGTFAGSTSTAVGHTVNQAATATTITSVAPEPSTVGQATTVSFSVTSGSGTPTGTVSVSDGTEGCSGTVAAGSCSVTFPTAGAKTLIATYAGDGTFAGSTSTGAGHTVNPAATTTAITGQAPEPSTVGERVDFALAVTA